MTDDEWGALQDEGRHDGVPRVPSDPDPAQADRGRILFEAAEIVTGDRNRYYGHPADNHGCTADLWRAYLQRRYGVDLALTARDVCWLNILQKASRDANRPDEDNLRDVAGYAENASVCPGEEVRGG